MDINTARSLLLIPIIGCLFLIFFIYLRKLTKAEAIEFIFDFFKSIIVNFHKKDFDSGILLIFYALFAFFLFNSIINPIINLMFSLDNNIIVSSIILALTFFCLLIQIVLQLWNGLISIIFIPFGFYLGFETANYFYLIIIVLITFCSYYLLFLANRISEIEIKTVFKNLFKISFSIFILALIFSNILDIYKYIAINFKNHYQFLGLDELKHLKNNSLEILFGINKNAEYELIKKLDSTFISIGLIYRDLITTAIIIIGLTRNELISKKIVEYTILFLIAQSIIGITIANISQIENISEYNKLKTYQTILYISLLIFIEFFSNIQTTFKKINNFIDETKFKNFNELLSLGFKSFFTLLCSSKITHYTFYAIATSLIIFTTNKISESKSNNDILFWIILSSLTIIINLEIKKISKYKKITKNKFIICMSACIIMCLSSFLIYAYTNDTLFKTTISFTIAIVSMLNALKIKEISLSNPEKEIYVKYIKSNENPKDKILKILKILDIEKDNISQSFRKKLITYINNLMKVSPDDMKNDTELINNINKIKKPP